MKIVKNKYGSYTATTPIKNGVSVTVIAPSISAAFYSCAATAKKIKNNLKNTCERAQCAHN